MVNSQKVATTLGLILAAIIICSGALFFGYAYGRNKGFQAGYTSGQDVAATPQSVQWETESYQAGYKAGHDSVLQKANSYELHNPTYQEMMNFLIADPADSKQFDEDEHMCVDFTAEVKNNAEAQGIRCAMIYIMNSEGIGHTIVAFDTTDRGLQFVEPQYDRVVTLAIGQSYSELNNFMPQPNDDIIRRYLLIW